MDHQEWKDLTDKVAREVYCIDMADGMIPHHEAIERWEAMPTVGSNPRITITHFVGSALIALEKLGFRLSP